MALSQLTGLSARFIRYHFLYSQRDLPQREEKTEHMMGRMRNAAQFFGVTEQSQGLVEALYLDYLAASDRASVEQMLESCGISESLSIKLDRQIGRTGNLKVWQGKA